MGTLSSAFLRNIFRENKKGLNGKKTVRPFLFVVAGAPRIELGTRGFGDHCSTS